MGIPIPGIPIPGIPMGLAQGFGRIPDIISLFARLLELIMYLVPERPRRGLRRRGDELRTHLRPTL